MKSIITKRLSEMRPGEKGKILDISGNAPPSLKRRILDMGLVRGTSVKVVRDAPLRDPVEFEALGYNLSLRRDEAAFIIVRVEVEE